MNEQYSTKQKKSQQRARKKPQRDLFTTICMSDLHVDCVKEYRFHSRRMWRFDYAIVEHKIALEVEGGIWTGGRHTRAKGFLGDMEKYNTATILGWRILRTTPKELYSRKTIEMLRSAIGKEHCED